MSKTSNKNIEMVWVIGMFALLFAATAIISPAVIQQREIFAASQNMSTGQITSSEKIQHLSNANVPVVLPLIKGYVKGHEVLYITTEASDKKVAEYLTNITGSRVVLCTSTKQCTSRLSCKHIRVQKWYKGYWT